MVNMGGEKIAKLLPDWLVRTRGRRGSQTLYLTFDDGPNEIYTPPLCKLLERHAARATFFCIGRNVQRHSHIVRHLSDAGHTLANHSQEHTAFRSLPLKRQLAEIADCQSALRAACGHDKKIFRAPQGQLGLPLLIALKTRGWDIVHWSYDSRDYRRQSLEEQLARFRARPVRGGDIVLFHDDNRLVLDILEQMLPRWSQQGFQFESVAELL